MTPRRHYERAPAVEVSITLSCDFQSPPAREQFANFAAVEAGNYPTEEFLQQLAFGFQVSPAGSQQQQPIVSFGGIVRRDMTAQRAFQARPDGLLVAKLRPYSQWEALEGEARRLWSRYVQELMPRKITSVQLRYVNQFDLPLPVARLDKFFRTLPVVADELPQQLSAYALQVNLPQPDSPSTLAVVREATVAPARPGVVSLVFDVQVSRSVDLRPNDADVWPQLEDLHERENRIFEASITDSARELIS